MQETDFYGSAHLFVAAIRILEHQNATPQSIDDVCRMLSFSPEQGNYICRKLKELDILEVVESAFGDKLYIHNHLKIEDIPKGKQVSRLEEELKNFQRSKNEISSKIESIKSEQAEKKKSLFEELEKNLKKGLNKE